MAKASGSTRLIKRIPVSTKTLYGIFSTLLSTGEYDVEKSYVNSKTGAFYLQSKGREPDDNERTVAKSFVDRGISITITPEGDLRYATAFKPDGTPKFSDGLATVYTYEQKTIEKTAEKIISNYKHGIQHAVDKGAKIAFIFDRYGKGHREQVEQAMREYQLPKWGKMLERVIVMNKNGDFFEHHF